MKLSVFTDSIKIILISICLSFLVSSCSNKSYESKNPEEYKDFWCDPKNIRESVGSVLSKHIEHNPRTVNECERRDRD